MPLQVDAQHGASDTSFTVTGTEQLDEQLADATEGEAHALFEEARRRARRRRRRQALALTTVVAAGLAVALPAGRQGDGSDAPPPDRGPVAAPADRTLIFVQLLTSTEPLAVVDPRTGRARLLPRLPTVGGDFPERVHVTGGRLVWNGPRGTYAIDIDALNGRPQRLGPRDGVFSFFVPSAAAGRVWFTFRERGATRTQLVETTVRGRVTTRVETVPPCRGVILVALSRTLLCDDARRDQLVAVDRRSGEVRATVPGVYPLAAQGNLVASCADVCDTLYLTDTATGRRSSVVPPDGFRFGAGYSGAFARDGSLLAVPVAALGHGSDRVALVDTRRRSASVIPGSRLADYRTFSWSPSGELYFGADRGRIMGFRPGARRARLLPAKFGAQILDLAAG